MGSSKQWFTAFCFLGNSVLETPEAKSQQPHKFSESPNTTNAVVSEGGYLNGQKTRDYVQPI